MPDISPVYAQLFDSSVKNAYEAKGVLRRFAYFKKNEGVNTFNFPVRSRGVAKQHNPQQALMPSGIGYTNVTVTPSNWIATEFTSIFNQAKTSIKEVADLADLLVTQINRREDQLLIDIWNAATMATGHTVDTDVGGSGTGLIGDKIRRAKRVLDRKNVPKTMGRGFVHSVEGLEAMLGETEVTSKDFNAVQALNDGTLTRWCGFDFEFIGEMDEGGLTFASGTIRNGYAVHMDANALGVNFEEQGSRVDWRADIYSWQSAVGYSGGAGVRDLNGIVRVQATE
jgi:hypothetical protein